MFTGIIEEVGAVSRRSGADLAIVAKVILDDVKPGDSVAVNGVCLTVAAIGESHFVVQISPETAQRSTLARLRPGDAVNLERAMAAASRFGGHLVLGHVDGVGRVKSVESRGEFSMWRFSVPSDVARYLVPKGSVAVDGISLTVVDPEGDSFSAAIIPTTLARTTLGLRRAGDAVNIEADVIGRHIYHYIRGLHDASKGSMTLDFLSRHGFARE